MHRRLLASGMGFLFGFVGSYVVLRPFTPWLYSGELIPPLLAPLAFVLGVLACFAFGALCGVYQWRRHRPKKFGLCPRCGYDLRGSSGGACPECGEATVGTRAA